MQRSSQYSVASVIAFARHINLYGCREAVLRGLQRGDFDAVLDNCDDAICQCMANTGETESRRDENRRRLEELENMIEKLREQSFC